MPLPVITDVFRCSLEWRSSSVSGITAANVIHVLNTTGTSTDVYNHFNANVTAAMWNALSTDMEVFQVKITPLDGVSPTTTHTTGTPAKWKGGAGSGPEPAVAEVITLYTNFRGRRNRGRVFLPGVAEGVIEDGLIGNTTTAGVQTAWETFLTAMGTAGSTLVVASYLDADANTVTSLTVREVAATQRRRQSRLRV